VVADPGNIARKATQIMILGTLKWFIAHPQKLKWTGTLVEVSERIKYFLRQNHVDRRSSYGDLWAKEKPRIERLIGLEFHDSGVRPRDPRHSLGVMLPVEVGRGSARISRRPSGS
jgi:hypothetical protein